MFSALNLRKFARDFTVAAIGFAGTYVATNFYNIGLSPGVAALVLPVYLLAYRLLRTKLGMGPEAVAPPA